MHVWMYIYGMSYRCMDVCICGCIYMVCIDVWMYECIYGMYVYIYMVDRLLSPRVVV